MGNSRVTVRLNDLNDCRALIRGSETKFLRFVLLTNVPRMILTWPHGMHATSHFTFANVSKTPYIVIRTVDPGGDTWIIFGWVCAARDSKLAPRSKKNFP